MANLSTYAKNAIADWATGNTNPAAGSTVYAALYNGDPSGAGSDVTATIASGGRAAITSAMSLSSGGAKASTNSSDITFTTSAIGSATFTYVAGFDAQGSGAGNMLWYKSVASNTVNTGGVVKILANGLTLSAPATTTGYSGDYIANWMAGKASFPAVTTRYLALFNGDPTGAGSDVTLTIRGAGRLAITSLMGAASAGTATNASLVNFGNSAGDTTVSYDALYDAATLGNIVAYAALTYGAQTISTGNSVYYPIAAYSIAVA